MGSSRQLLLFEMACRLHLPGAGVERDLELMWLGPKVAGAIWEAQEQAGLAENPIPVLLIGVGGSREVGLQSSDPPLHLAPDPGAGPRGAAALSHRRRESWTLNKALPLNKDQKIIPFYFIFYLKPQLALPPTRPAPWWVGAKRDCCSSFILSSCLPRNELWQGIFSHVSGVHFRRSLESVRNVLGKSPVFISARSWRINFIHPQWIIQDQ